jgi:hypothetical protein
MTLQLLVNIDQSEKGSYFSRLPIFGVVSAVTPEQSELVQLISDMLAHGK